MTNIFSHKQSQLQEIRTPETKRTTETKAHQFPSIPKNAHRAASHDLRIGATKTPTHRNLCTVKGFGYKWAPRCGEKMPGMLLANKQSQAVLLKTYEPLRDSTGNRHLFWDPTRDIITFSKNFTRKTFVGFVRDFPTEQVRFLAIRASTETSLGWLTGGGGSCSTALGGTKSSRLNFVNLERLFLGTDKRPSSYNESEWLGMYKRTPVIQGVKTELGGAITGFKSVLQIEPPYMGGAEHIWRATTEGYAIDWNFGMAVVLK